VVEATAAAWGRIDILVNNAGAARGIPFDELTQELWLENLQLKLFGYLRMARLVLPHLRRNAWGRIVNVAGVAGLQPSPLSMPIGLNNAGILNVMKALADGEAAHNILVTTVCPGPILTERQTRLLQDVARTKGISLEAAQGEATSPIPLKRMGRPEEVADVVAFYEKALPAKLQQVKAMSGDELTRMVDFFGMFQKPAVGFLGMTNNHSVHHRGQLAAYLRALGSKVPDIYGPSGDSEK